MPQQPHSTARRDFLKHSGIFAAGTVLAGAAVPKVHAAENNMIRLAVIGCGGRGSGATMQALTAEPNLKLWALGDAFADRANGLKNNVEQNMEGRSDLPADRLFSGLDAYKNAMDALEPGDAVILATPPLFRPLHFEYAVEKGLNIFAEKPLAVDIPGLRRLQRANEKAREKGLRVAVGLNNRHSLRTEETVKAIHDGKLGDVVSMFVYRFHNPHRLGQIGDRTPLQHQLRNIFCFNMMTGGFLVDALIHNIDICCWAKQQLPVACQAQGGRIVRTDKDDLIDEAAVEYIFADGKKLIVQTRTIPNTWSCFQATIHGTKGACVVGEGVNDPLIFSDYLTTSGRKGNIAWAPTSGASNSYQVEHDRFFAAIREGKPWNELDRGIEATFTPILGRWAMETGQYLTAEQVWESTFEYAPNIDTLTIDSPSPFMPDADGNYPIAVPGVTKLS